ncbi:RagB/SusD family nutrient uptake outer membrane protein [Filimonas effusa]|nr:RagB/SusD family nutrient uptake outer membrane protein [Filimonas effusa]
MKVSSTYLYIVSACIIVLAASCKKSFLEVEPKGFVIAGTADDYGRLLTNASLLNISANPQVILGDDIIAIKSYFDAATTREQRLFRWEDEVYEAEENAPELDGLMTNIYLYNKIINEVMNAEGPEAQKKSLRAEALTGRAWTLFLLINFYGKPYNPATATHDAGFPLVNTADVSLTSFSRASVQEVYDQILGDLETAINDLPAKLSVRLRMSRPLGKALLGKVYLFMQQPEKALPLLNSAFDDLAQSAISVKLYNYNQTFATGGAFLPIATLGGPAIPTHAVNEENIFSRQFSNTYGYFVNTFVMSPAVSKLFKPGDLRLKFYSTKAYPSGNLPAGAYRRIGPLLTQVGFVLPDLYLLRAECFARNGELSKATDDLLTLRKNRMPATEAAIPADTSADKIKLLSFIMEERQREFAVQGYRWFDMRRLSVDPLLANTQSAHQLMTADGIVSASYSLKPERLVLRFPRKVMAQNPGMNNNP